MGLQNKGVQFSNVLTLGNNSPTAALNVLPTLVVSSGGSISLAGFLPAIPGQTPVATQFQVVNFITGAIAIILQSATLIKLSSILLVNTSNKGVVQLSLDNGGTINGLASYALVPGQATSFTWDGVNLNQNLQFS